MEKSQSIQNIAKALMMFQSQCPAIEKSAKAYSFKYADLPSIVEIITPILTKNNLCFSQLVGGNDDNVSITTILIHTETGEFLQSCISSKLEQAKGMTKIQSAGSVITYLRRYSLSSILGIVTDIDVDGHNKKNDNVEKNTNVEKNDITPLIDEVLKTKDINSLQDLWRSYQEYHTNSDFLNAVNSQKAKLQAISK